MKTRRARKSSQYRPGEKSKALFNVMTIWACQQIWSVFERLLLAINWELGRLTRIELKLLDAQTLGTSHKDAKLLAICISVGKIFYKVFVVLTYAL